MARSPAPYLFRLTRADYGYRPPHTHTSYPTLSRIICQSFACDFFENDERQYLKADYSLSCKSDRYIATVVYAALSLVIYSIGIPLAMFVLLWRWRRELNPPGFEDETRAVKWGVR